VNHPNGEAPPFPIRGRVFALARHPNVYLKVHGLGEFCRRTTRMTGPLPFERAALSIWDMAYQAFGPQRIMWGSDYPPVSGREGYTNALSWTREQVSAKGDEAVTLIFGGVAAGLFGL
jgi:L-fuconolactonase